MNCKQFQEEYILHLDSRDTALSPEMQQHLQECRTCGGFVRILNALEQPAEPSEETDRMIRNSFRLLRQRRKIRRRAALLLLSAAAAVLLLCSLTILHWPEPDRSAPQAVCRQTAAAARAGSPAAPAKQTDHLLSEWEIQLMATENEMENLELEMSFLLTSL